MNGIEKIIDRIKADAAAECRAIMAEAETRSAEIEAERAKAAGSEYEKVVGEGVKKAGQRLERLLSVAALEEKKQVLETKQEMVRAAFDRAVVLLSQLPDERYIAFLARLAAEASRSGSEVLAFSARDLPRVGEAVKNAANARLREAGREGNLSVSENSRNIRGGVAVTSGDIETNCSLEALVGQHRSALAGKVADILFD